MTLFCLSLNIQINFLLSLGHQVEQHQALQRIVFHFCQLERTVQRIFQTVGQTNLNTIRVELHAIAWLALDLFVGPPFVSSGKPITRIDLIKSVVFFFVCLFCMALLSLCVLPGGPFFCSKPNIVRSWVAVSFSPVRTPDSDSLG